MDEIIKWEKVLNHKKLKYRTTAIWFKEIVERINQNKNFLCVVVGQTGSGKSLATLAAASILDENFDETRVAFTPGEFLNIINKAQNGQLPKGSVIVFDEAGLSMSKKEWWAEANRDMVKILELFRHLNLIVFFTVPDMSFIDKGIEDLLHAIWEMKQINPSLNRSTILAKKIWKDPTTPDRAWRIYLTFFDHNNNSRIKIKYIYLKKPPVWLVHAYEKKKDIYASKIYKHFQSKYQASESETFEVKVKYSAQELVIKKHLEKNPDMQPRDFAKLLGLKPRGAGTIMARVRAKMELENVSKPNSTK